MANLLIQVDADLSDELTGAFPHMVARHHSATTTLTGTVADQQEMLGVMSLLVSMGADVLVMVRIPDDRAGSLTVHDAQHTVTRLG